MHHATLIAIPDKGGHPSRASHYRRVRMVEYRWALPIIGGTE